MKHNVKREELTTKTVKQRQAQREKREKRERAVSGAAFYMHRSLLNILDSLLANQIQAKGVVTIVCRIEIRKMAEC